MVLSVNLEPADEQGWIVVECPALPGCVSQGRTEEEALRNIKEAAIAWLWAEGCKSLDTSADSPRYLIDI